MTLDLKEVFKDAEAGTPGPWYHTHVHGWGFPDAKRMVAARDHNSTQIAGDCPIAVTKDGSPHWETPWPAEVNAKRIARVPDLEVALLAAEELAEAVAGCLTNFDVIGRYEADKRLESALTAYRKEVQNG